ncbi:MAG TPA: alpha/beta hydrolase [Phenylobacterium sp.]|nr:alpha/beta hydrolase [Phenylobacterium sp.]
MKFGSLTAEDASLYYEVRGEGPPLLLISGAGGDAGFFDAAADALADTFTVITYDRRGNSRSGGRTDAPMRMEQQADDAKAIIDGLAGGKALVFGNSLGALIALELAARHPEAVTALIAHEPPAVRLLPDLAEQVVFFEEIYDTYCTGGAAAAAPAFASTFEGEGDYEWPQPLMERFMGNVDFLFQTEWNSILAYEPRLDALRSPAFPIVMAGGSAARGHYCARSAAFIAREIGAGWAEFPGIHLEMVARPAVFAAALRVLATGLHAKVNGSIPAQWSALDA